METCAALSVSVSLFSISTADRGVSNHMTHSGNERESGLLAGRARGVLADIIRTLQATLADLPGGHETDLAARRRVELLSSYQRQLKAVLDLEGSLDTSSQKEAGGAIDLDAARSEIRERLARLRERGGS
ncbi:hypothetical protein [Algicella marina]|uniref:Uncharacterized protein n=1 Tax=Algicella marina TaxID=2683284 RepID=A0A6P1SVS0_9RHOB|nr:hypothetical protein [Algicella marina]QHQ34548.1 hypothetical protein GO499_04750 [Algicella marina]